MRVKPDIPADLQAALDRELEPGEKILWIEQPIPRFFTPTSTLFFSFGILVTAFAVNWICTLWLHGAQSDLRVCLFSLAGVPFLLMGLTMLSTPCWVFRKVRRTVYAITDRRAITCEGVKPTTIHSFPPEAFWDAYCKERSNGTGDVILARRTWRNSIDEAGFDGDSDYHVDELGFLGIREPKQVEAMLKSLARQRRSAEE